jgi:uncharacterized membrane protein
VRPAEADIDDRGAGAPSVEAAMRATIIIGVAITLTLVIAGLLVLLVRGDPSLAGGSVAKIVRFPNAAFRIDLGSVIVGVRRGRASALIEAGLLVLVVTPLVRETVAGVVYARRREWVFVGLATAVVLVLAWTWRAF